MTAETAATTTTGRSRAGNVALWILQALLAGMFLTAALPKISGDPVAVAGFDLLGLGMPGMYVVGWLELAGAVALLIPRLCGLAATCQIALMIGAVATTAVLVPGMVAMPAVVLVAVCVVAWYRRGRTAALVRSVRR